ncbi:MAG: hypothetical protein Q4615_04205 [Paracoccus aminovorans]|nr:hypothetical protein [Paracoccus aminovorans]
MTSPVIIDKKKLAASGLPVHLQALIVQLVALGNRPAIKGAPGRGIQSVAANPETGALTVTMTDGATASTGRLTGRSAYELAQQLGYAGTLEQWMQSQRGVSSAVIQAIETGTEMADGSRRVLTLDGVGDLMRLDLDGLDFVPGVAASDRVMAAGSVDPGAADADDGLVIEALNGEPLRRVYPDGMDFVPSQRLIARLAAAGLGGAALTEDGWATAPDGSFTAQAGQHGISAVDRFFDREDGVRLPVPLVDGVRRKAVIISGYGQSLADVTRMADPLVWDTPPFPHHAQMLDDMNAYGSGTHRGGMMGWQGVAVPRGSRMINASEALRGTQSYMSAAFARLIHWDGPLRRVGLIRSSAWGGNRLVGTAIGAGIWKDSAGAYTQSWINWTGDLAQARDLLTAAGYEVEAIYICFSHQEADAQTPRATYLADFLSMKAEREALVAAAMPGVRVHWFCDQASGSGLRNGYLGGRWPSRLAIVDACRPETGGANITLVTPRYWFPTGAEYGQPSNVNAIHHSHNIRPIWGELFAHAMRAAEKGQPWRCPVMSSAAVSGNEVIVGFDSLLPIVIDPTFCKVRADAGFTVNQGAIPVLAVRQTGPRQITLTCGAAPTGSVEYARRQQDAQDELDDWPISTGAIRDARSATSLFDPLGRPSVRAALGYQLPL